MEDHPECFRQQIVRFQWCSEQARAEIKRLQFVRLESSEGFSRRDAGQEMDIYQNKKGSGISGASCTVSMSSILVEGRVYMMWY